MENNTMEPLSIKQLLDNYILIIPEIQREYVWGMNTNVLQAFLNDLDIELIADNVTKNIGFLYSYTIHDKEHYIIDGQQRLTTMILMLYVKSVQMEDDYQEFKRMLQVDAPTMTFSYNVRPLTEQFLRQLFSHRCISKDDIENQKWYIGEYKDDITIKSILGALDIMASIDAYPNITFKRILDNVKFWYFDVKQTSQGEELYITMNSRGEKLTESEQIKPRLFESISKELVKEYGKLWDNWEEFFFHNRPMNSGSLAIRYVDIAMNNFIRIVSELLSVKEQNEIELSEKLSLPELKQWFEALERIPSEDIFRREINRLYETKEDARFLVLKSLLVTAMRQPDDQREYFRVRATMRNNVIRRKATKHLALLKFLNAFQNAPQNSFYEFVLSGVDIQDVLAPNEKQKIQILFDTKSPEIEETFWKDEHHCIWSGDINPLIVWATNENSQFHYEQYQQYSNLFNELFKPKEKKLKNDKDLDVVRRALLTQELKNYPGYYRSRTNQSFAYEPGDWKYIIDINPEKFKSFFDELLQGKTLLDMIDDFNQSEKWSEFVKKDYLLGYCHQKNIQWYHKEGWRLIPNERATKYMSVKNRHLNDYLETSLKITGWDVWIYDESDGHVIVVENKNKDFVFDIWYREPQPSKWVLNFFRRKAEVKDSLKPYLDDKWWTFNINSERYERSLNFFDSGNYSYSNVLDELTTIINKIESNV